MLVLLSGPRAFFSPFSHFYSIYLGSSSLCAVKQTRCYQTDVYISSPSCLRLVLETELFSEFPSASSPEILIIKKPPRCRKLACRARPQLWPCCKAGIAELAARITVAEHGEKLSAIENCRLVILMRRLPCGVRERRTDLGSLLTENITERNDSVFSFSL